MRLSGFFFAKSMNINITKKFEKPRNSPHFFGAMEGKHIAIQNRDGSSRYRNYKNTNSILSLPFNGSDYECLNADFGARCDDGGIWK